MFTRMTSCQLATLRPVARAIEYGAARHPLEMPVIVLAPDRAGFGHVGTEFADLIVKSPQRRTNRHRRHFAAGILVGPWHARQTTIFFGQSRVEHASEIDIAGRAAGADNDGLARADIRPRTLVVDRNAEHRAGVRGLPVDRGHSALAQNLDTRFFGGDL